MTVGIVGELEDLCAGGSDSVRRSAHITLERLQPHHLPEIHQHLSASPQACFWRSRGRYIPSQHLEAVLVGDGRQCLAVCAGDRIDGLVELCDVNLVDGHAQLSAITWRTGLAAAFTVEALILAMDHWFCSFAIDQLFIQTAREPSRSFRRALDRYFDLCGSLPAYINIDGTRHDVLIYSMTRERFIELSGTRPYFRSLDVRLPTIARSSFMGT